MTYHVIRGAGDCIIVGSLPVWSWASCWYSLGFLVINNIPVIKRLEELRPRSVSWTWAPHTVVFLCVWFYKDVIREPTTVTLQWRRGPSFSPRFLRSVLSPKFSGLPPPWSSIPLEVVCLLRFDTMKRSRGWGAVSSHLVFCAHSTLTTGAPNFKGHFGLLGYFRILLLPHNT